MKHQIFSFVDVLTAVMIALFCTWLGWWGLLSAFAIGTAINIWIDRKNFFAKPAERKEPRK